MKQILMVLIITYLFFAGCNDECKEHLYTSTVVVDVSDSVIINQFKHELPAVIQKLGPASLSRCEGIHVDVEPIGASIENPATSILFPANGVLASNMGNYDLADSNSAKAPALYKGMMNALHGFRAIGDDNSQIFYTVTQILNNKKGRVIIYTDCLEHYGNVSFYKGSFDFEKTYKSLLKQYSLDCVETKFNGTITIVSPMGKHQDKILNARKFFKYYFDKLGIPPSNYEFIGSISQTRF